ncbi:glycophorin-A [Desmodus rotundus]|uniref:glycophorin-A n=1 Tax=Desmodus rotundus TaxID=9430 RepID=UPI000D180500|nr:glycophorin-A [Desmodus rotundus]
MYRNIIIGLLLSGCISSFVTSEEQGVTPETKYDSTTEAGSVAIESHSANVRPTEQIVTRSQPVTGGGQTEARKQLRHDFSEPVIIIIIFGVMAGIIGTIVLLAYGIKKLSKRSPPQAASSQNTGEPLSSVETGNPVLPQNNNE